MYRSRNRIPAGRRRAELGALFGVARSNNKKQQITGALLIFGDWFAQVLEGEETAVRALFAKIEKDGRHEHISVLESGQAGPRVFARWAASRGTTPEQEAVLDVMRAATRNEARTR
jgi:hypothetical protein